MINKLAVLMTFGAIFPPLAAVVCFAVMAQILYLQTMMGRYVENLMNGEYLVLSNNIDTRYLQLEALGHEVTMIATALKQSAINVLPFAALFYSLFIFDTAGDDKGWVLGCLIGGCSILSIPVMHLWDKYYSQLGEIAHIAGSWIYDKAISLYFVINYVICFCVCQCACIDECSPTATHGGNSSISSKSIAANVAKPVAASNQSRGLYERLDMLQEEQEVVGCHDNMCV
jgi:hypothetical protein